jgi:hypothetical protein
MAKANIIITQDSVSSDPGVSRLGVPTLPVTLSNEDNTNATKWEYEILEVPLDSAVVPGVISSGSSPTASFVPDEEPGCYRIKITVFDVQKGQLTQIRNFCVPTCNGWIIPPFSASSKTNELNFPGYSKGWSQILSRIILETSDNVCNPPTGPANLDHYEINLGPSEPSIAMAVLNDGTQDARITPLNEGYYLFTACALVENDSPDGYVTVALAYDGFLIIATDIPFDGITSMYSFTKIIACAAGAPIELHAERLDGFDATIKGLNMTAVRINTEVPV